MSNKNLLVELFVEELPPKALKKISEVFSSNLRSLLKVYELMTEESVVTAFASPRRLGIHITAVAGQAPDKHVSQKLMPVSVGIGADGKPTSALIKKLASLGMPESVVSELKRASDGKVEALFIDLVSKGLSLADGLQNALENTLKTLPIPKVMTYQLADGWETVNFVRPAHGLVALHGSDVVNISMLGLKASNTTQGHRFEAKVSPVVIKDADSYAVTLTKDGAVIASFAERRAEIVRQLAVAAAKVGGGCKPIEDDALLDEVTSLVERPNVLICEFEKQFLEVPQECLILTMKANQKYFPLLDAANKLTNKFLVVSNITPDDASFVIGGNERVVRPRLADAKFFFDQDRKKTLASRVEGLGKVVYHNKLGTQGERVERVRAIAKAIAAQLGDATLVAQADQAAQLAKTDLVTDMVGEFPELQGIMGGYYALNDGLPEAVAHAIEDHYKPRFAGDDLPRNTVGLVVALADKLETLAGLFSIKQFPTGDKDPFALRRHALGVIRMLVEKGLRLDLFELVAIAEKQFPEFPDGAAIYDSLREFIYERLAGNLREQGYSSLEIESVLAVRPRYLSDVVKRLEAVRAFAALPESAALAAANKRISNILKKTDDVDAHVSEVLLQEAAEKSLYASMKDVVPKANAQFDAGDYTASLQTLAALRVSVDAFFEDVMVNAEALDLRLNRLGLLKCLHDAMNRVADLSKLAA